MIRKIIKIYSIMTEFQQIVINLVNEGLTVS